MWLLIRIFLLPAFVIGSQNSHNIMLNGQQYPAGSVKRTALTFLQLSQGYDNQGIYTDETRKKALEDLVRSCSSKKLKYKGDEERELLIRCKLIWSSSTDNIYKMGQITRDFIQERYDKKKKKFKFLISDIAIGLDKGRYALLITGDIYPESLVKTTVASLKELIQQDYKKQEDHVENFLQLQYAVLAHKTPSDTAILTFQQYDLFNEHKNPHEHINALLKHYNFYSGSKKTSWDDAICYFDIP